jgi:hypothetical protein
MSARVARCLYTKNPILVLFRRTWMASYGIFNRHFGKYGVSYGHLSNLLWFFGMLYHKKSGNTEYERAKYENDDNCFQDISKVHLFI